MFYDPIRRRIYASLGFIELMNVISVTKVLFRSHWWICFSNCLLNVICSVGSNNLNKYFQSLSVYSHRCYLIISYHILSYLISSCRYNLTKEHISELLPYLPAVARFPEHSKVTANETNWYHGVDWCPYATKDDLVCDPDSRRVLVT